MKKVLVTGGCGFIGSNFIKYLLTSPEVNEEIKIINLDKQTYAGQGKNIEHMGLLFHNNYKFIKGDIVDKELINTIFQQEKPDIIFNFAAESHVDRSIESPEDFILTNVIGVTNLLDAVKKYGAERFIQISTDEVYGSTKEESFDEISKLNPSSPYSSSKAAGELQALAYAKTFNLPVIITRSANNFGPYQFPEKVIPLFITNLIEEKKVPLMWSEENPGLNVRDWVHVEDNCRAIWFIYKNGQNKEIYNISNGDEKTNIYMTKLILNCFNAGEEMIEKIPHRKAHDFRYSIKGDKLKNLNFKYNHSNLEEEIENLVKWYKSNETWWKPLKQSKSEKGIIFGEGYLGTKLRDFLGYSSTKLNPLNLEKLKEFLDKEKPDIVINAIGKTGRPNIDWCEENKQATIESNTIVAANLCIECSKRNIYFVHLGSGCIYYGDKGGSGFTEEDEPNFYGPQFYAKSKILAEKILKEFPCLILRIRMPIGEEPHERNLIDKLLKYEKLIDIQNSMTTIPHLLKATKKLIDEKRIGIYNMVNPGTTSAAEIIKMYKELINPNHNFTELSVEGLDLITKGKRSNCFLNSDKLKSEGIFLPEIHDAVKECLLKYKENINN
tara:strand:- start:660 stop:2489 length:1830 start_codon:yes stop_codon:yes gene_type:complete